MLILKMERIKNVYFSSDVVKFSYVTIEGIEIDELKVKNDGFIEEYYYPNLTGYEILDFTFKFSQSINNQDEYMNKLKEYLNKTLGGTWNVYFNPNGSITCIKND